MITNLTDKDSSRYRAVFLDLDGTITDSGEGCMNGLRYMFKNIGREIPCEKELRRFLGPPIVGFLMQHYGLGKDAAKTAYAYYREYYLSQGLYENRLYDGIEDVISAIKRSGKSVYIATSKPEAQAVDILTHFNILDLFDDVFAARHDLGVYGKIDVLERAVSLLGETPERAVMVGDRFYDIEGGRHVGFDTIGVLYGYGDADELSTAGCDIIVDSVSDLSSILGRKAA